MFHAGDSPAATHGCRNGGPGRCCIPVAGMKTGHTPVSARWDGDAHPDYATANARSRNLDTSPSPRPCRCERPHFGPRLRVCKLPELNLHAARDGGHFIAGLKASEIRSVLPRPWAAQLHTSLDGRVVDDIDLPFVIGIALLVAGKITEVAAGGKNRVHSWYLGDLVGVL